jgi:hypothetical protein
MFPRPGMYVANIRFLEFVGVSRVLANSSAGDASKLVSTNKTPSSRQKIASRRRNIPSPWYRDQHRGEFPGPPPIRRRGAAPRPPEVHCVTTPSAGRADAGNENKRRASGTMQRLARAAEQIVLWRSGTCLLISAFQRPPSECANTGQSGRLSGAMASNSPNSLVMESASFMDE